MAEGAAGADDGMRQAAAGFARAAGLSEDDVLGLVRGALVEQPGA